MDVEVARFRTSKRVNQLRPAVGPDLSFVDLVSQADEMEAAMTEYVTD